MTISASPEGPDQHARNARIRELSKAGWSNREIGDEVGLSDERVRQILAKPDPEEAMRALERALHAEARVLEDVVRGPRARLTAIRRQLARIEEEREAARIDRILGLP